MGDVCDSGRLNWRNDRGMVAGGCRVDEKVQEEKLLGGQCKEWEVWLEEWTIPNGSRSASRRKRRRM